MDICLPEISEETLRELYTTLCGHAYPSEWELKNKIEALFERCEPLTKGEVFDELKSIQRDIDNLSSRVDNLLIDIRDKVGQA